MKRAAYIPFLLALLTAACNSGAPETVITLDENQTDSATATIEEIPDSTLQPVVAITLKALGDTLPEVRFDQDTLLIPADALIELKLINEGTDLNMVHNFVVTTKDKYKEVALAGAAVASPGNYVPKSKDVLVATPLALPGQTVNYEFKALPVGVYSYVCTYPDHWHTMHGTLIVKE
ncbi:azurin [Pontibacter sp. Tf4]|uniref:plastocyanin/azurin family copper-binding protein n=1 Tax=Pontibacter sp. Tf4 TaxID=2761620 RepID=UPI001628B22B|nr:plastocyanin/azurin family copper-binding protein [Pontibacter sp. Tf4]MBB6610366.1 azurin [Pontibacter sp. Tf4]